jgi:hypothetical protein
MKPPLVIAERARAGGEEHFSSPEIVACQEAGITVTLPKLQTSGAKDVRFGKQD